MGLYYLFASFPPLEFDSAPEIGSAELTERCRLNMSTQEFRKLEVIKRFIDVTNILQYLTAHDIDHRGNFDHEQLEFCLHNEEEFPDYVYEYLGSQASKEDQIKNFPRLIVAFFDNEAKKHGGFLQEHLEFERGLRITLTGYRCHKWNRDIAEELQFEDPNYTIVAELLAKKDASNFEFPYEFKEVEKILSNAGADPLEQHRAIEKYRFDRYAKVIENHQFTLQAILAYLLQQMILEDLFALSKEKGEKKLTEIVERKNV